MFQVFHLVYQYGSKITRDGKYVENFPYSYSFYICKFHLAMSWIFEGKQSKRLVAWRLFIKIRKYKSFFYSIHISLWWLKIFSDIQIQERFSFIFSPAFLLCRFCLFIYGSFTKVKDARTNKCLHIFVKPDLFLKIMEKSV